MRAILQKRCPWSLQGTQAPVTVQDVPLNSRSGAPGAGRGGLGAAPAEDGPRGGAGAPGTRSAPRAAGDGLREREEAGPCAAARAQAPPAPGWSGPGTGAPRAARIHPPRSVNICGEPARRQGTAVCPSAPGRRGGGATAPGADGSAGVRDGLRPGSLRTPSPRPPRRRVPGHPEPREPPNACEQGAAPHQGHLRGTFQRQAHRDVHPALKFQNSNVQKHSVLTHRK